MDKWELFLDGLKLLVFGMGAVFAFLGLMIFCMKVMYNLIKPFIGMLEPAPKAAPQAATGDDANLAAVAAAAVELFRKSK